VLGQIARKLENRARHQGESIRNDALFCLLLGAVEQASEDADGRGADPDVYDKAFRELIAPIDAKLAAARRAATPDGAPQDDKCPACDGKGGWVTAEWIDPVSGPECEGERCGDCGGTGRAAGSDAVRDVLARLHELARPGADSPIPRAELGVAIAALEKLAAVPSPAAEGEGGAA